METRFLCYTKRIDFLFSFELSIIQRDERNYERIFVLSRKF